MRVPSARWDSECSRAIRLRKRSRIFFTNKRWRSKSEAPERKGEAVDRSWLVALGQALAKAAEVLLWIAAGAIIGFDLGINVSDPDTTTYAAPDGHRLGQYFFNVTAGGTPPFFEVGAFCLPTLAP